MTICVDCLNLKKRLDELGEKYDSLLKDHAQLLKDSTGLLKSQRTIERDQQINLTSRALQSFKNAPITLSSSLKDENENDG